MAALKDILAEQARIKGELQRMENDQETTEEDGGNLRDTLIERWKELDDQAQPHHRADGADQGDHPHRAGRGEPGTARREGRHVRVPVRVPGLPGVHAAAMTRSRTSTTYAAA